jgi:hypothetical protein
MAEDSTEQETTIIVDNVSYPVSGLSDQVKELIALHNEAMEAMLAARRSATIHEVSMKSLANMISTSLKEGEETDADSYADAT